MPLAISAQTLDVWAMRTHQVIRRLQQAAGLSQGQMAIRLQTLGLDVSQPWISQMERGLIRLTPEMLPYIAFVLGVTPNDLVRWEAFLEEHRKT